MLRTHRQGYCKFLFAPGVAALTNIKYVSLGSSYQPRQSKDEQSDLYKFSFLKKLIIFRANSKQQYVIKENLILF